jgi:hypothetical protein
MPKEPKKNAQTGNLKQKVIFLIIAILAVCLITLLIIFPVGGMAGGTTSLGSAPLMSIHTGGGLCPYGGCSAFIIIKRNGLVLNGTGGSKSITTRKLNNTEIIKLTGLINSENFSVLISHKFTGTCPTAYDGQESIYVFNTSNGNVTIDSCVVAINYTDPLFSEINLIISSVNKQ